MNRRIGYAILAALVAVLFSGLALAVAQEAGPPGDVSQAESGLAPASVVYTYTTVITVTSGTDPDNSQSTTCYTNPPGPPGPPAAPCTLRRAIVEARALSDSERPVLIRFNIPTTETQSYSPTLGIWKINLLSTSDASVLRRLDGRIIIDGDTQSGGRTTGPKILLVGPTTGQKDGLVVGDVAGDDGHVIRGLGFQNFKTHMFVNTRNNLIENNWFGLSDDGASVYLRNNNPQDGSGSGGIETSGGTTGASNNTIRNNVFLGFDGMALSLKGGGGNVVAENRIGTNADGNVLAKQTDPSLVCTPVDWLGGGGISIAGINQRIENNVLAGLRQEIFAGSTQPDALRVSVTGITGHVIQNNRIGVDMGGREVGVCGRGIYMSGDMQNTQVISNAIVNPGLSGISLNDLLYDAATLRRNVIKHSSAWPQVTGNPKPEDAIQLGPLLPDPFELFQPAKVMTITGKTVSGASGNGSPCASCVVELFLDDTDAITEALQSLAVVTATASGNWTATLPSALSQGQGIRTTSTSTQYGTISGMSAGTTTGLSVLYVPPHRVFLPVVIRN